MFDCRYSLGLTAFTLLALTASSAPADAQLQSRRIASGLATPVYATAPPGETERLYVLEQRGVIRIIQNASAGRACNVRSSLAVHLKDPSRCSEWTWQLENTTGCSQDIAIAALRHGCPDNDRQLLKIAESHHAGIAFQSVQFSFRLSDRFVLLGRRSRGQLQE